MKKIYRLIILFMAITSISGTEAYSKMLTIVMDDYPPFSYREDGEIRGISTQVVKAVLEEAGMDAEITQLPFARAYKMAQKEADIFEYCVARTPEREKLFQWVGVVTSATHGLIALKDRDIYIQSPEDLKPYTIGTVIEDIVEQYLRRKQSQFGLKLDSVSKYEANMKKLFGNRIDLWAGNQFSAIYLARKLGYSANDVKVVYTFDDLTADYYLVTGPKTSVEIVRKLRTAFETIHMNGIYQKIISEYFIQ